MDENVGDTETSRTSNPLMQRIVLFIESENFDSALEYCEKVLDQESDNGWAYFFRVMAEAKITSEQDLIRIPDLDNNPSFIFAQRFADDELKTKIEKLIAEREEEIKKATLAPDAVPAVKAATPVPQVIPAAETAPVAEQPPSTAKSKKVIFLRLGIIILCVFALLGVCGTGYYFIRKFQQKNFSGIIELPNDVILEMVKVEPGTFIMSKDDGENDNDEVEHSKSLTKPFYIGKYAVTNEQWCAVMGVSAAPSGENNGARCPVVNITWHQAMIFCEKMNKYAPPGWKFTLPTETQWEFAARGGNRSRGFKYSGSNNLYEVGWYRGNSRRTIHPVGEKRANELGLYDMSGNVSEWCLDNWEDNSKNIRPEFTRPYRDDYGLCHVRRGGSWSCIAKYCRPAYRNGSSPDDYLDFLGFRLALVPEE